VVAFPLAQVTDDDIFIRNEKVWTSAGITAGIDMMLAIIEDDFGHDVAIAVAKGLVLFLRRPGRQAQFSHVLMRQENEPEPAGAIRALIGKHLTETLHVERLAELAGMSERNFGRFCSRVLNQSPAALVRRLRVEEAQRLLEQTDLPMKRIAEDSGLGDPATLWRAFSNHFGVTPAEYRARFR
jgi:transcriptional regulator GlxA family with amidase domain